MRLPFRKPKVKEITPTGYVINMDEHKFWGDNLYWWSYPGDKRNSTEWVLGTHAIHRPTVGDEIRCKMKSGRTGRWVVREVEYIRDPPDMFFAKCDEHREFYLEEV